MFNKNYRLSSLIAAINIPLASLGVEGITTLRPEYVQTRNAEICYAEMTPHPRPIMTYTIGTFSFSAVP